MQAAFRQTVPGLAMKKTKQKKAKEPAAAAEAAGNGVIRLGAHGIAWGSASNSSADATGARAGEGSKGGKRRRAEEQEEVGKKDKKQSGATARVSAPAAAAATAKGPSAKKGSNAKGPASKEDAGSDGCDGTAERAHKRMRHAEKGAAGGQGGAAPGKPAAQRTSKTGALTAPAAGAAPEPAVRAKAGARQPKQEAGAGKGSSDTAADQEGARFGPAADYGKWVPGPEPAARLERALALVGKAYGSKEAKATGGKLGGGQLLGLGTACWQVLLGVGQEEAEGMAAATIAAAVAGGEVAGEEEEEGGVQGRKKGTTAVEDEEEEEWLEGVALPQAAYEVALRRAFTAAAARIAVRGGLAAARAALAAGTGATLADIAGARGILRRTIAADRAAAEAEGEEGDEGGGSEEGVRARMMLSGLIRGVARTESDLDEAEVLLREVITISETDRERACMEESDSESDGEEAAAARAVIADLGKGAKRALGLMLAQAGRDGEAAVVMAAWGARYRLSRPVLRYSLALSGPHDIGGAPGYCSVPWPLPSSGPEAAKPYVRAIDGALPDHLLAHMVAAFGPGAGFWRAHEYNPDGSTPFFSYVHPLPPLGSVPEAEADSTLDLVIRAVHARAAAAFPAAAEARFAEWWAHCRPHPSGHQLHFDSDNEGRGQVRNPIVTNVLYVTGTTGGPTLVTPQAYGTPAMAQAGWLVPPARPNRLATFNGTLLHGVIPGAGLVPGLVETDGATLPPHRVTFMVALWGDITLRPSPDGTPGAAQPFPTPCAPSSCTTAATNNASGPDAKPGAGSVGAGKGRKAKGAGSKNGGDAAPAEQTKGAAAGGPWTAAFHPDVARAAGWWPWGSSSSSSNGSSGSSKPKASGKKRTASGATAGSTKAACAVLPEVTEVTAVPLAPVWEDVDVASNGKLGVSLAQLEAAGRLPAYDQCFQGF